MRVMILTPWPFRIPRNGGQLRASAIVRAYQEAGHHVRSAGFYHPVETPRSDVWPEDIALREGTIGSIFNGFSVRERRSEMAWWRAIAISPDNFQAFVSAIECAAPDVLQFEEMALWPVVRRLMREGYLDGVKVVHSSYNFETLAWRNRAATDSEATLETLQDISEFERQISEECDMIVVVSKGDADEFRNIGARNICIAPNGVEAKFNADEQIIDTYMPSAIPYALFVSSAHPPNAHGIVDLAARAEGHPLRHGEIVICGKVGALMRTSPRFASAGRVLDRCRYLGWVDDAALGALYARARVIILPKLYSGGSNLKTAEAVVSGRPVVATRLAFEGFEGVVDLPNVVIADEPNEFWSLVSHYMSADRIPVSRSAESVQSLLWQNCLRPMIEAVSSISQC